MIYKLGSFILPSNTEKVSAAFKSVPESDPAPVMPQPFPQRLTPSFQQEGTKVWSPATECLAAISPYRARASSGCFSGRGLPRPPRSAPGPGPAEYTPPTSLGQDRAHRQHEVGLLVGQRVPHMEISSYSSPFLAFKLNILCNLKYSGLLTPSCVLLTTTTTKKNIFQKGTVTENECIHYQSGNTLSLAINFKGSQQTSVQQEHNLIGFQTRFLQYCVRKSHQIELYW